MKNILSIITVIFLIISVVANAQDITNTLAPNGNFKIKDGSADYLSLSQSTGFLSLNRSLVLPNTTSPSLGVIFKGTDRFIHNYGTANTFLGSNSGNFTMTGAYNTAIGFQSLFYNTTGSDNTAVGNYSLIINTTGNYNTALGSQSLRFNTIGYNNTALGDRSLYFNFAGNNNTALGYQSLYTSSSSNNNTALGYQSLYTNSTGTENTALGHNSLFANTTGNYNTALGYYSLSSNTAAAQNTAVGHYSLAANTTGFDNTAVGFLSLRYSTTGFQNTALGNYSLQINTTGNNNTAIGYDAQVPSGTASNQVRIGNTNVTYAGVQVAWSITSDIRWKENIQTSNLGLGFITKLNPVSYTRKNDEKHKTEFGLIAQELGEVLKSEGIENTGMLNVTDEGYYELRYNDLLAPMIKAIQELKIKNEELTIKNEQLSEGLLSEKIVKDEEIAVLKNKNQNLEERLSKFEEMQTLLVKKMEQLESNEQLLKVQIVNSENNN